MNINKNISEYGITKGSSLLTGILSSTTVDNYPLNWTQFGPLPLPTDIALTLDSKFNNLGTNHDIMTHIVPTGATT